MLYTIGFAVEVYVSWKVCSCWASTSRDCCRIALLDQVFLLDVEFLLFGLFLELSGFFSFLVLPSLPRL
jgi:hypothetical protein